MTKKKTSESSSIKRGFPLTSYSTGRVQREKAIQQKIQMEIMSMQMQ
jgi:hypothetical protein